MRLNIGGFLGLLCILRGRCQAPRKDQYASEVKVVGRLVAAIMVQQGCVLRAV